LTIQNTIKTLLRGSSSSVSLSSRGSPSPFVGRVSRVPHPPSALKSGTEAAYAKRRLLLTSTQKSCIPPADAGSTCALSASIRSDHQSANVVKLFPPLPRKRS
jgi:hypothetical protein